MSRTSRMVYARYVRGSLRMRLLLTFGLGSIVLFLLIRIISFTGIPWIDFAGERDMYVGAAEQNLQAIADEKKETLQQWFQERLGDGRSVVHFPAFRMHAIALSRFVRQSGDMPVRRMQNFLFADVHYHQMLERLHILNRNYAQYSGIEVLDLATGIRTGATGGEAAGTVAPYAKELQDNTAAPWGEKIFFGKDGEGSKIFLFMAFAVRTPEEKPVAALVFRIEPETFLLRVLHESAVLGRSGEIILIDMQKMLLTPLKHRLSDGTSAQPLAYILQTKAAEVASLGVEALFTSHDYRGIPILVAVRHVRITPDFGLGLIVKRDEQEVFAPVRQSLMITTGVTGLGLIILMGLVFFAAGAIARPIENLTETARKISAGDLAARSPLAGSDEVSELARAFNDMAGRIQQNHVTLEHQVAERTGELTIANQLLRVEMMERREAEKEIRASEERFRQLAENIPEVFWIGSSDWQSIYYISPAYERVWGRRCEELYTNPSDWLDAAVSEDRDAVLDAIPKNVTAGEMIAFPDYRIKRPDGTIRWIAARAFPIVDAEGNPSRVAGIAEDITERKQLETQLVQAQKMESVGRLAGGVAHDFNNMLAIIFISLELARMNLSDGDPVREQLDDIEKAATHSRDITRQLLAFSRQQMISPRLCNLNTLIADLEKSLGRLIGEDIELRFYPDQELESILIDPSQIDQVLVNLAVNARDAMPHGGKLTIATANVSLDETYCEEHPEARPGHYIKLSVSDEGVGMDKETLAHIFEPFFTTKEVGKGTGLGLATIYGVVKQNGGFVNVYSEAGYGTSFNLFFPRLGAAEHPAEALQATGPAKGDAHVLMVEDDEMLCRVTKATLEALGYTVTAAHSPAEALALFEKATAHFDLLLTDVVMPGMNGRELAERIETKSPGIKVVFMSGYTSDVVVHRGVLDDGVQFIQKPFSIHVLAGKIREVMQS